MYPTCLVFYVLSCFTFLLPCVFLCLMCLVCYVLLFLPCLVLHVFSCYTYLMLLSHVPHVLPAFVSHLLCILRALLPYIIPQFLQMYHSQYSLMHLMSRDSCILLFHLFEFLLQPGLRLITMIWRKTITMVLFTWCKPPASINLRWPHHNLSTVIR